MFKVTDLVSLSTMFYLTIVNKTQSHSWLPRQLSNFVVPRSTPLSAMFHCCLTFCIIRLLGRCLATPTTGSDLR